MADRLAKICEVTKVEIIAPAGVGRARLSVGKLGPVGEPESSTWLEETTEAVPPD
ncbi:hypothetical protein ACH4SK_27875 [Streptomyces inhibens]|uniref:hypothetical protein n=1 Tax=Streptomyces inhibens TaxID=2293571 RepID=UPI0037A44A18